MSLILIYISLFIYLILPIHIFISSSTITLNNPIQLFETTTLFPSESTSIITTSSSMYFISNTNTIIHEHTTSYSQYQYTIYTLPYNSIKTFVLCAGSLINIIQNDNGSSLGTIPYFTDAVPSNFRCHGSFNTNKDELLVEWIYYNGMDSKYYAAIYFYNDNTNELTLNGNYLTLIKLNYVLTTGASLFQCERFDTNGIILCGFINYSSRIESGVISNDTDKKEISINEQVVGEPTYACDVKVIKISANKIMISSYYMYSDYLLAIIVCIPLGDNSYEIESRAELSILNPTYVHFAYKDEDSMFILEKVDNLNYNLYTLTFNDGTYVKHVISLENASTKIYITMLTEELIHFTSYFANGQTVTSTVTTIPICSNIEIKKDSLNAFNITSDMLTQDQSELITINYNHTILNTFIEYHPVSTEPHTVIEYSISNDFGICSDLCTINLTICNQACLSCSDFSYDIHNTKCIECNEGYYPLENDDTLCYEESAQIEMYFYNNELQMFSKCYDSCLSCIGFGNESENNCTSCKDDLMLFPYNNDIISLPPTNCICDIITANNWYVDNSKGYVEIVCADSCPDPFIAYVINTKQCVEECPEDFPFLQDGKCVTICSQDNNDTQNCLVVEEVLTNIEQNIVETSQNNGILIETDSMLIEVTNTSKIESGDIPANTSVIYLGECETILKRQYNLPLTSDLIIMKLDIFREDQSTNQIEYNVYSQSGQLLDLSYCKDTNITISLPLNLPNDTEFPLDYAYDLYLQGYDIYNSSNKFFTDICTPFTSNDNTDVLLEDRKKYFYQNLSLCEEGCTYGGIDYNTERVNCTCTPKEEVTTDVDERKFSFAEIGAEFQLVIKNSNLLVIKCYLIVFSNKILINIGNWILLVLFIAEVITFIFHCVIGDKMIAQIIDSIITSKPVNTFREGSEMEHNMKDNNNDDTKKDNNSNSLRVNNPPVKSRKIKHKKTENKEQEITTLNTSKQEGGSKNTEIKIIKKKTRKKKRKQKLTLKDDITTNKDNNNDIHIQQTNVPSIQPIPITNEISIYSLHSDISNRPNSISSITTFQLNTLTSMKTYSNEELDDLPFQEAIIHDKRTFCKLYYNFILYKQLLLFTFVLKTDFNLRLLKISLFIFGNSMFISLNALFFSDESMSRNYRQKGKFDLIYSLPQTLFSSIFCAVISFLMEILSLSQSQLQKIKEEENINKAKEMCVKFKKCHKIKVIIFYIFVSLVMLFFWYFISAFCGVYVNTQKHLLIDTLVSFVISMIVPFGLSLITALFRYYAIQNKNKCLFCLYKVINFF